jgi:lysozyme family protein
MDFDDAFDRLIGNEGELSMDRHDRGNWSSGKVGVGVLRGSKYGISAASYPKLDIGSLTLEQAKIIYKEDFWDAIGLDDLPNDIKFDLFDTAVNSGVSRAIKLLQKAVGAKEDGILGPNTINNALSTMNIKNKFNAHRLLFMCDLDAWKTQGKGWARRIANNLLIG